jgi:hypothetical protein
LTQNNDFIPTVDGKEFTERSPPGTQQRKETDRKFTKWQCLTLAFHAEQTPNGSEPFEEDEILSFSRLDRRLPGCDASKGKQMKIERPRFPPK